jgi:hypothetical protein
MHVYKLRQFASWADEVGLLDGDLLQSVYEMEDGLVGNQLVHPLFKKRIATNGKGKSSGFRVIIAYKVGNRAFFLYGFSKNQRENITKRELDALRNWAKFTYWRQLNSWKD